MKQVNTFKFVVVAVIAEVFFMTSAAIAIPIRANLEDVPSNLLSSINKNFEVVEGPKEFLLPLAPLKVLLARYQRKSEGEDGASSGNLSDLDYMVYGKVYLMKALGISDRSLGKSGGNVVSTTDKQLLTTGDAISFPPTTRRVKRPYQYKYWNTPKPSDYKDFADGFTGSSTDRKIGVRSAGTEQPQPMSLPSSSSESGVIVAESATSSSTAPTEDSGAQFAVLDEEAQEPPTKLVPEALAVHETTGISSQIQYIHEEDYDDVAIPGNNSTTNGSIELDNRFLINVPQKPMLCPEGQKRTHRGACKPIFVHNPSPHDGIFGGRLTAPKIGASSTGGEPERGSGVSQLSALVSSFIKLEQSLERAVKETEQKLGEMVHKEDKDAESNNNNGEKQV